MTALEKIRKQFITNPPEFKNVQTVSPNYVPESFRTLTNDLNNHYFKENKPKEVLSDVVYLYIMKNNRNGYFKIGRSKNPTHRERTLQSEEPDVSLMFKWTCKPFIEKLVHRKFFKNRIRGEWFKFTDSELLSVLIYINKIIYP